MRSAFRKLLLGAEQIIAQIPQVFSILVRRGDAWSEADHKVGIILAHSWFACFKHDQLITIHVTFPKNYDSNAVSGITAEAIQAPIFPTAIRHVAVGVSSKVTNRRTKSVGSSLNRLDHFCECR